MNYNKMIKRALNILDRLENMNDRLMGNNRELLQQLEVEKRAKMQAIAFIIASGNHQAFQQYARQTERTSTEELHKFILRKLRGAN